jgi:N-acetylneuraminate synthase/N,N'-diacetyllegionaminate synthase
MNDETMPWDKKVFIIAEAGVNHNGSLDLAKKLIDAAKSTGADAVKFQTWKNEEIMGKLTHKVEYIDQATDPEKSLWDILNDLALSYDDFRTLQDYANKKNILFLSTPDGFESLDFLVDELNIPIIKIGSTEVTHLQYLTAIAKKQKPIILSTGLSSLGEVEKAVATIRSEYQGPLVLLHCNSSYPSPPEDMNLRAMTTLEKAFDVPVGLSDHSEGSEASIAAVAMGAKVIEKHFTLDKNMSGPDHKSSLDVKEFTKFVSSIRNTELLLGDGVKRMTDSEAQNLTGIRRSIVAKKDITKGTCLSEEMLTCKRPGTGISPDMMNDLVGLKVNQNLLEDEPLMWKHFR